MKTPFYKTKLAKDYRFAKEYIGLNFIVTKKINKKLSSIDFVSEIKNKTERCISNEAFQVAARSLNLKIEFQENTKNEYYNLSIVNNN